MKRILSLVLAMVMVLGSFSAVFAVEPTVADEAVEVLMDLGVLTEGKLDQEFKRQDTIVLLSRLMGEEEVAKDFPSEELAFEDVIDPFYTGYVAWAVSNKLTDGKSATKFGFDDKLKTQELAMFVLRVLGYDDVNYDDALVKAAELGVLVDVAEGTIIKRGDMAVMTLNALKTNPKDSTVTLAEKLGLELPAEEVVVPAAFELEGVTVANLREVDAAFNKDVDEDSLDKANFLLGTTEATSVELLEDAKTVRAIFTMENQKEYTLKIKTVKSVDGMELKDLEKKITPFDNIVPVVENVEVFGNKKVVVTFSEPVDEILARSLANYKINDKLFGAKITVEGREVHFELTARLADGVHTFVVNTNIKDYAGFKVSANSNEIVVAKDDVKPGVASVDKATQTKVVVTFTEPVESNFKVKANVGTFVDKSTKDNLTYTLNFDLNNPLPLSGTEITLTDVTDYYGNKDTVKVNVVPELDIVRPEVVSVTATKQTEIVVEFSKEVALNGTYILKTTDTTPVQKAVTALYVVESSKTIKTKVKLTTDSLKAGDYTLEIKAVEDLTPLKNVVIPTVVTVSVADLTPPTVVSVKYVPATTSDAGAIYVYFLEKLDADSALDKANYSYVDGNNTAKVLGSSNSMTLLADEKVVKIALPKLATGESDKGITSITIVGVKDLAGNKMSPKYVNSFVATALPASITLSNPEAIAVNKVVVTVSANINPYTVTPSDFVIRTSDNSDTIYVIDTVYNATKNTITMTLSEDLTPAALYDTKSVRVVVVAQNLNDIYGNKIAYIGSATEFVLTVAVADKIVPTLDKVETGATANRIKFTFSETVNFDKTQLVVKVDGKVIDTTTAAVYAVYKEDNTTLIPNVFEVEFVGLTGETIEVGFPTVVNHIQDSASPKNSLLSTGWFEVKVK